MIRLSERLQGIADWIEPGSRVADIGTDHGYIPIWLKQTGRSDYIVAGDIHEGPLQKMRDHLDRWLEGDDSGIFLRKGDGLKVIGKGEADTAVIAGMGGLLMIDILSEDPEKTLSVKRFLLQPRNAQDKLRKWLLDNGFTIADEKLVRESRFVWEILLVETEGAFGSPEEALKKKEAYFKGAEEQYEIGQHLIRRKDPNLPDQIRWKQEILQEILDGACRSDSTEAKERSREIAEKLQSLERILNYVNDERRIDPLY